MGLSLSIKMNRERLPTSGARASAKVTLRLTLGESYQVSAVHIQGGSGNEACLRTGKESDHCCNLIGVPESLER